MKNVLTFSLFLLLSTCFWFVHALNGQRKTEVVVAINYTGIPENVELQQELSKEITVLLHDEGRKLFAYNHKRLLTITFDLSHQFKTASGSVTILPEQIKSKLSDVLQPTSRLLDFSPDTLKTNYVRLKSKQIPVRFEGSIQPAAQYRLMGEISLTPTEITVYGPASIVDTLRYVPLENTDLQNVKDTFVTDIAIQKKTSLRYNTPSVKMQACAEMFTEKSLILPIWPQHFPENLIVRTFPSEVTVTFNVDVSQFANISESDLKAVFDYQKIKKGQGKQSIQIRHNSPYIFNVRVIPEEVEFLLEEK